MADIKIDPRAPKRAILDALCATLDMVSKEGWNLTGEANSFTLTRETFPGACPNRLRHRLRDLFVVLVTPRLLPNQVSAGRVSGLFYGPMLGHIR